MIAKRVTFSTGILRRPTRTKFALVDVVNFNKKCSRRVTVAPHKSVFLFADVSKVKFKYEVRITQLHDRKLVTNVTGVTNAPFTPQEGDTVLQRSLIKIK
ncbi:hypothetical protein [Paenibacillus alginolyticus]|uniref:Uncharacterized protein n=1 Tax=Paenibacillus alginolyticus TaxID=59839 RepID=A0ABT4G6E4_9BACL|nr:hypothetical protein [Paenibacillus alginolyticus]MCY9691756.1 hypothetical protein [Paenibacillus alginolyticus]MEC0146639.1 hypothetical protein [Paenibacillus alginolyticus]